MPNIFESRLVRLRAPEPADDAPFRQWVREDTESQRTLFRIPFPERRVQPDDVHHIHAFGDNFDFIIETLDGVLVGSIDAHGCNPRSGTFEFGIGIFTEHQAKGYGSDALRLLLAYYFYEKRYQKCHSVAYSFNAASIRLHERSGFTLEARLRRMVYSEGAYHDELHYGITAEAFGAMC